MHTRVSVKEIEAAGEKMLARVWQHQSLAGGLVTREGMPIKVVFPGRQNGLGGPDFRRAIMVTPQGWWRGDVEVHLRSSQWLAHGHHRDPAYNGVILHVVLRDDAHAPARLANGHAVPTLALEAYLSSQAHPPQEPCRRRRGPVLPILEALGEARFRAKAEAFRDEIECKGAGQALYEGVMVALGYSQNQEAFCRLACSLPLVEVEAVVKREGLVAVQALLLGSAGLLSSSFIPRQGWLSRLEEAWASLGRSASLQVRDWQRQGVRPENLPQRRLAALSYLLVCYSEGWLKGLMTAVARAAQGGGPKALEAALVVPALLGRGRVGEVAVNVLLPFAWAWGMGEPVLRLYRAYPAQGSNQITREMADLLGGGWGLASTARCQQGLIHLYKAFCAERFCSLCPLGSAQPQAGEGIQVPAI